MRRFVCLAMVWSLLSKARNIKLKMTPSLLVTVLLSYNVYCLQVFVCVVSTTAIQTQFCNTIKLLLNAGSEINAGVF